MASSKEPLFAFFGTPHFAVRVLDALEAHGLTPALVVCAPDKPRGRGLMLSPAPAKAWALKRGIDTVTPASLNDEALAADLANTDWDVFVVAAYGALVPQAVLSIPRAGCLNVHPSLLPKYRGASPVYSQILADDRHTGVTIMHMLERMDAGPIVAQARIEIAPEDWPLNGSMLLNLLATEGGNLLAETLKPWIAGDIDAAPQDESLATYTRKLGNADALLNLDGDPRENLLKVRAFDTKEFDSPARAYFMDEPGSPSSKLRARRVIVTEAHLEGGALIIDRVIPEGRKEMAYADYRK